MSKKISISIERAKAALGKEQEGELEDVLNTLKFSELIEDFQILAESIVITTTPGVDLSAYLAMEEDIELTHLTASNPSKKPRRYDE